MAECPRLRRRSYEPLPAPRRGGGPGRHPPGARRWPSPEGLRKGEEKMSTDQPTAGPPSYVSASKAYDEAMAPAQKAYDEAGSAAEKTYDEAMAPGLQGLA